MLNSVQNRQLLLSESFEIIDSIVKQLNCGRAKVADAEKLSWTLYFRGEKNLKKIFTVISDSTVKVNLEFFPADIVKLKYTST